MHGLKLVIKEDVMPQEQMPDFPALAKLAANGFLSVVLNFKATVEIPMLGTMIENYGDTLEEAHMPLGWPISIDGAVRQLCMHKKDTIQELNSMLAEFNLQRSSVEINCNTNLWAHNAVWNKKFMDPAPGQTLQRLWDASEHYICRKFFFRPAPLWLPPGRRTLLCWLNRNIISAGRLPDPGTSRKKQSDKW